MSKRKEKTVFILGAGASLPYGFPTSRNLRKDIIDNYASKFSSIFKKDIYNESSFNRELSNIKEFQKTFDLSSIYSIDYFISRNPRYIMLGKDAIIIHLLEYERNCKFRESTKLKECDWYSYLYNYMISDFRTPQSLTRIPSNFTFITFNYDRSLEYFFADSLAHSFEGINTQNLKEFFQSMPIIHIYGKVANLPLSKNESGLKLGDHTTYTDLNIYRNNIKTICDNFDDISLHLSEIIDDAERIFFLGFGYDKLNLLNLTIPASLRPGQKIFGTVYGFNKRFIEDLKKYFIEENLKKQKSRNANNSRPIPDNDIIFENVDSLTLLQSYL